MKHNKNIVTIDINTVKSKISLWDQAVKEGFVTPLPGLVYPDFLGVGPQSVQSAQDVSSMLPDHAKENVKKFFEAYEKVRPTKEETEE